MYRTQRRSLRTWCSTYRRHVIVAAGVVQLRQDPRLAQEPRPGFGAQPKFAPYRLDRHPALQRVVETHVHRTHAALAKHTDDADVTNLLTEQLARLSPHGGSE